MATRHLILAAILALLACLSGCSEVPAGLEFQIGIEGSPPGLVFSLKTPARFILSGPSGFAVGTPTTAPAEPAPTEPPATAPAE